MTTGLHDINFGMNQYCGPAVLSALTGKSTDECAAVISAITGKSVITAVHMKDLMEAFKRLRFDTKAVEGGRSLYGTLMRLLRSGNGFYVVMVPRHVVAVEIKDGSCYLVDNASKQPLVASNSARLMQRVDGVYQVIPKPQPVFVKQEFRVTPTFGGVIVWKHNIYENQEDNIVMNIGRIAYKNREELNEILKLLSEKE